MERAEGAKKAEPNLFTCGGVLRLLGYELIRLINRCRADCGKDSEIKPKDAITCRECGGRILYKKRTKKGTFHTVIT